MLIPIKFWLFLATKKLNFLDAQLAITVAASVVASILLNLILPKPTVTPTKLQNKDAPSADYGFNIPIGITGSHTYQGSLIWALPLGEILEEIEPEGGGGGKGFGSPTVEAFAYYASCAYILAYVGDYDPNTSTGVPFNNTYELLYLKLNDTSLDINSPYITFYNGSYTQNPDPTIALSEPDTPAYRGFSYIVFDNLPVKNYGNSFFAVTAVLKRGNTINSVGGIDRVLNLAQTDNESPAYTLYPNLASIQNNVKLFKDSGFLGFRLPSSGQSWKESLEQLGYCLHTLGKTSTASDSLDYNAGFRNLGQTHLVSLPINKVDIGRNRERTFNAITIPYRFLGTSEDGDYASSYQIDVTDVSELADEIKVRYYEPLKDYNANEITYNRTYRIEKYRTTQSKAISTDLACSADQARQIAEHLLEKSYDTNRVFTITLPSQTFNNIFIGQYLVFPLTSDDDYYAPKVGIIVTKITKGLDYSQEVQGYLAPDITEFYNPNVPSDNNYTTLPQIPPDVKPSVDALVQVYDLPFTQPSLLGKLGCWVAIDDLNFIDGTKLNIWYKIDNGVWINSGTTINARGKFANVVSTDSSDFIFDTHLINKKQLTLDFDNLPSLSSPWTLDSVTDLVFDRRLANLAIFGNPQDSDTLYFATFQNAIVSLETYLTDNIQIPAYNLQDLSPYSTTPINTSLRALVYGTGRQTWFSLPISAIGETVSVVATNGDPSVSTPTTFLFKGRSFRAPTPVNRKAYKQNNGDWLLSWDAVDIYDQVWKDSSDSVLDSPQFYTVAVYYDENSTTPERIITTLTTSVTYPASDIILDNLDTSNVWAWSVLASYSNYTTGAESTKLRVVKNYQ